MVTTNGSSRPGTSLFRLLPRAWNVRPDPNFGSTYHGMTAPFAIPRNTSWHAVRFGGMKRPSLLLPCR